MSTKAKLSALSLSVAVAAMLVACGGGGGGSSPVTTSVSGVASKGIIANGLVEAYKIENGQTAAIPAATATTDASGNYVLTRFLQNAP